MDKINNIGLSRLLTSVYDFDGFTEQEVWCRIAQKINIIIEHFNYLDKKFENEKENTNAKLEYLLGEGLQEQVAKIILEKINDGTLGELINGTLLKDINDKVDEFKTETDKNFEVFSNGFDTKLNVNKTEITDYINRQVEILETNIDNVDENLSNKILDNEINVDKIKNANASRDLISVNASTISSNTSTFMFSVKEDKNMQSLCYHDNYVYVGFALEDNNNGLIIKYDMSGKEIARSETLPLEHCSSMVFNNDNNKLYITNGGGNPTKIFVVNPSTFTIEQTYNFGSLGKSSLITLYNNNIILHTGENDASVKSFYKINSDNSHELLFTINTLGTPQGLASYYNSLYYLTNNGLYELDYEGNILNTISIYTDSSEPQGLTVCQINGSDSLMYGKNKWKSDNNVNNIYSITNLEAHKKTSLRMIGSYAPKSNSGMFLSPVMLNFSVRKLNGEWTHMNWNNIIAGSENIIKDITAGMNSTLGYYEVTIDLNIKLTSYAQCIVTAEQSLFISGYAVHGQLDTDGTTVHIRFKKTTESEIIDPTTLADGNGVIVTLIGGMKI